MSQVAVVGAFEQSRLFEEHRKICQEGEDFDACETCLHSSTAPSRDKGATETSLMKMRRKPVQCRSSLAVCKANVKAPGAGTALLLPCVRSVTGRINHRRWHLPANARRAISLGPACASKRSKSCANQSLVTSVCQASLRPKSDCSKERLFGVDLRQRLQAVLTIIKKQRSTAPVL